MKTVYAFPSEETETLGEASITKVKNTGMSLRDYFAGQALVGLSGCSFYDDSNENLAKMSYETADAMMKERSKKIQTCVVITPKPKANDRI